MTNSSVDAGCRGWGRSDIDCAKYPPRRRLTRGRVDVTIIPKRALGDTGIWVSTLGYGGAPIGFASRAAETTFIPMLRRALDLGITFFDTAPDYRRSEELIGQAFRGRRGEVFLASKVGRVQTSRGAEWEVRQAWSEEDVLWTVERSLRRLGTDYLDLAQLHSPPPWVLKDGGALTGLQRARTAGKVRHIGISADGAEAWQALELGAFATLQVSYSILQQEPGADLLPAAAARGMGVIVKQPLANGIPELRERPSHPDWVRKWDIAQHMVWPEGSASPDRWSSPEANWPAERGASPEESVSPGSPPGRLDVALRWLLANPLVSTAIVGTTRRRHLEANVAAATAPPLPAATVQRIQQAYTTAQQATCLGEARPAGVPTRK